MLFAAGRSDLLADDVLVAAGLDIVGRGARCVSFGCEVIAVLRLSFAHERVSQSSTLRLRTQPARTPGYDLSVAQAADGPRY